MSKLQLLATFVATTRYSLISRYWQVASNWQVGGK
jgi:hypothetical protein